jgi:hypothetical protein
LTESGTRRRDHPCEGRRRCESRLRTLLQLKQLLNLLKGLVEPDGIEPMAIAAWRLRIE